MCGLVSTDGGYRMNEGIKTRFLDATEWLCEKMSPMGVTLDLVAERAKVGKGSIYRYFQSKDDLFQHIITERITQLHERIIEVTLVSEGDYMDKLRTIAEEFDSIFKNHQVIIGMSVFLSKSPPFAPGRRMMDPLGGVFSMVNDLVISLIKVGVSKGELRSDISPALLTLFFQGVFSSAGRAVNHSEPGSKIFSTIMDLFLNGAATGKRNFS